MNDTASDQLGKDISAILRITEAKRRINPKFRILHRVLSQARDRHIRSLVAKPLNAD